MLILDTAKRYVWFLTIGTALLYGTTLVSTGLFGSMTSVVIYRAVSSVYTPPVYHSGNQTIQRFVSILPDDEGFVQEFTQSDPLPPDITSIEGGGESMEVQQVGETYEIGLRDKGIVPGTYRCPTINVTSDRVIQEIATALPVPVSVIQNPVGTVADAITAAVLQTTAPFFWNASRQQVYDSSDFAVNTTVPGRFYVSLISSAVELQTCSNPLRIDFGSGQKVNACLAGSAPGTPNGTAVLGPGGIVLASQLNDILEARYRGKWDAAISSPALTNASCAPENRFYYSVSVPGNTNLGGNTNWMARDLAVCVDGQWIHVECTTGGAIDFLGRNEHVVSLAGDYTSLTIPFRNGTLDDFVDAPHIVLSPEPDLPNSLVLTAFEDEISKTGATIGLQDRLIPDVPFGSGKNFSGYITDLFVDRTGFVIDAYTVPSLVRSINGTTNQVIVTGTAVRQVSLPQPYDHLSNFTCAGLTIGSKRIVPLGPGSLDIGQSGVPGGSFAMTEGAISIPSTLAFTFGFRVASGNGIRHRDSGGVFTYNLRPSTTQITNWWLRIPGSTGAVADSVLTSLGTGDTVWDPQYARKWREYTPTITNVNNVASSSLVHAFFQGNIATPGSVIDVILRLTVTRVGDFAPTVVRVTLPGGTSIQGHIPGMGPLGLANVSPHDDPNFDIQISASSASTSMDITLSPITGVAGGSWWAQFSYNVA
jgi:hypothetical protein